MAQDATRLPYRGIFGVFWKNTKTDPENILAAWIYPVQIFNIALINISSLTIISRGYFARSERSQRASRLPYGCGAASVLLRGRCSPQVVVDQGCLIMALYRCLFFIGMGDKITNLEEADHADDARANDWGVALLRRHPHYKACEVWLRQRLIGRHDQH